MLQNKKCMQCNATIMTFANNPYCRKCMNNVCCMAHTPSCDGRMCCNCTFDAIEYNNNMYCLGHFKNLQNKCAVCGILRPETCTDFQHDYMWYCSRHKMSYKTNYANTIYNMLKHSLCLDTIVQILTRVIEPVRFRYPESFNIPNKGRKPLKQYNTCNVKHNGFY